VRLPHPSAERAALGEALIDDCDQLQVRVSDGHYPVRGAPVRMVSALDGLESVSVVEDATTGSQIRRCEQHVIDGQLRKTRRNSIRPSSVHPRSLPAQDARTRGLDQLLGDRPSAESRNEASLCQGPVSGRVGAAPWARA